MAVLTQWLRVLGSEQVWAVLPRLRWRYAWPRQKIISDAFRLLAFGAAILQIIAFPNGIGYNAFPDSFIRGSRILPWGGGYNASELIPVILLGGLYSMLKIAQPFSWHQRRTANLVLLSVDVVACVLLVNLSGGIHSPFILYTLVPVLTAALTKNFTVTVIVSAITGIYVLDGSILNAYNAASNYAFTLQAVNDFFVYSVALSLVAALPYSINLTEGRKLQSDAAALERGRISRDLHDSVCQTLCGLRWQVQRLSERVASDGSLSDELKSIEKAVTTAEEDARGLLNILCTLGTDGGFLGNIKHHLEQLRLNSGISYEMQCDGDDFELEEAVERELSMICIEALANIKKHATAKNVAFRMRAANGHIQVRIVDDGRGFDGSAEYTLLGHGLSIMRERAESISGTLRITSHIGKGTEIEIEIPG